MAIEVAVGKAHMKNKTIAYTDSPAHTGISGSA